MIQPSEPEAWTRDELVGDYARALRAYLDGAGEDALSLAYELGRAALANGVGVVEITLLHHAAAELVAPTPTRSEQERLAQFLAESLSLYELTHRGFRDANARLEQAIRDLRAKNRELEQATRELKLANENVRETNRELEAFSHSVAHDLRSPLNVVIGFAELLDEGLHALNPKLHFFAVEIAHTGRRMNRLIAALLEFARDARAEVQKTDVDLSSMASRVAAASRAGREHIPAQISIAPNLRAHADPALLEIVLTNLLSNALKYSAQVPEPKIEVGQVLTPEGHATFFVHDNGAGFDMANAGKLFRAFQRLHSRDEFEGHGVGLATVQRIIRRHGGEIWAEGAVGQGATFYFTLAPAAPRHRSDS